MRRPGRRRPPSPARRSSWSSAEEGSCHAAVHRNEQARGKRQVAGGQRRDRGRDVLGEHLPLEQRPAGVERAQLLLRDTVDCAPLGGRRAPCPWQAGGVAVPGRRGGPRAAGGGGKAGGGCPRGPPGRGGAGRGGTPGPRWVGRSRGG